MCGLSHLHFENGRTRARSRSALEEKENEREKTTFLSLSCVFLRVLVCKINVSLSPDASRHIPSPRFLTISRVSFYSMMSNVRSMIENVSLLSHSIWNHLFCAAGTALAILSSFSARVRTISRRYPLHVGARDNPK